MRAASHSWRQLNPPRYRAAAGSDLSYPSTFKYPPSPSADRRENRHRINALSCVSDGAVSFSPKVAQASTCGVGQVTDLSLFQQSLQPVRVTPSPAMIN